MVECLDAGLQEQVCPAFGPLHGLLLDKSFAEQGVNRRLHKCGRNRLPAPIPLAIVGNEAPIVLDIRAELLHGFFELWEARVEVGKVINAPVQVPSRRPRLKYP